MNKEQICWVDRPKSGGSWGGLYRLKQEKRNGIKAFFLNSMGTDHFPVQQAEELGFIVKSLKDNDYCSATVDQNAFKMLFDLMQQINGEFPFELEEKQALIIGGDGRIGSKIMKIAKGFGMNEISFDIDDVHCTPERLLIWLAESKVIFFACDLNDSTKNYFKAEHYREMEKKPLIINPIGRLKLLDLNRMEYYLNSGSVGGYACDDIPKHKINNHLKCLFTNHNAWQSTEARDLRTRYQEEIRDELLEIKV